MQNINREMVEFDFSIDEEFIRSSLNFLFEDDVIECSNSEPDKSIIYNVANSYSNTLVTWSSSSSGSLCSSKEESSNYVNFLFNEIFDFPQNSNPSLYQNESEDNYPVNESLFSHELPSSSTSTPKKIIQFNDDKKVPVTNQSPKDDKENINPQGNSGPSICKFCFKNGEPSYVYKSHTTKDTDGKPLCPILRKHICELCGATGDQAHTRKYCNLFKDTGSRTFSMRRLANGVVVPYHNHK